MKNEQFVKGDGSIVASLTAEEKKVLAIFEESLLNATEYLEDAQDELAQLTDPNRQSTLSDAQKERIEVIKKEIAYFTKEQNIARSKIDQILKKTK